MNAIIFNIKPELVNYRIRDIEISDVKGLLEIEKECFPSPWPEIAFLEEITRPWSKGILIEDKDREKIIGYAIMWIVYDECHLINFAINPIYQGKGFGNILMESVINYAKKKRAAYIVLEVRRSNKRAINLYKKYGFKIIGIRPRYYHDNNEDAYLMLLNLRKLYEKR